MLRHISRVCLAAAILIAPAALLLPATAFAQSAVGRALNAATGQSLRDAVDQQQKDLLDNQVHGNSDAAPPAQGGGGGPGGAALLGGPKMYAVGGQGGATGGAAIGAGAIPTGRVRSSSHDAFGRVTADEDNYAWRTHEASAFGTGVYAVPGTVLGGQMKLSMLVGENWLTLKMRDGGGNMLDPAIPQSGEATNESLMFGGSAIWSNKSSYMMATAVGFAGRSTIKDQIDFFPGPALNKYEFETHGFIGSLTAGHVFQLTSSQSGPMLDLRAVAGYTRNTGTTFENIEHDTQKYDFGMWTVTGMATLFANIPLGQGAVLRPYIDGYVRREIDYSNKLHFFLISPNPGDTQTGVATYDMQAHTYGGVDIGLTYVQGQLTVGSAIYFDGSSDERTLGGRIGASWKLN